MIQPIAAQREKMGEHGGLGRMLGQGLVPRIFHKPPTVDIFHAKRKGKKRRCVQKNDLASRLLSLL